jgi:FlaA1/EpsC-like NDP-sugar epimerase
MCPSSDHSTDNTHRVLARVRSLLLRKSARELAALPELHALLGRKVINLDTPELQRFIGGKRILITGAGGSIGSELCRQAARFCPERLVLIERAENALFEVDRELRERWIGVDVRPCVADITDVTRIDRLFAEHRPHVVFHAAAHKHVPMMEANPGEAIKNNILGTQVVARASTSHGVDHFVLISTDKAVNPTSVMGATKRIAEMVVQAEGSGVGGQGLGGEGRAARGEGRGNSLTHSAHSLTPDPYPLSSRTRFSAVRFGNVLGSSGSVVPIFQRQIDAGGPVTVTHPEMRRYFMTIPEATQLVMQAGAIGAGGEIFVLDMGEPVLILDLARQMIARAGLVEDRDITIRFTGVRPGEKLFEELSRHDEATRPTDHAKIRVWDLPRRSKFEVESMLAELAGAVDASPSRTIATLGKVLEEFAPAVAPVPGVAGRDRAAPVDAPIAA